MLAFTFCVIGIYTCFLTWGVLQERVSTTPYGNPPQKFTYFILLNAIQATLSAIISAIYLAFNRFRNGKKLNKGKGKDKTIETKKSSTVFWKYLQCAVFSALASPFGYASLKHISYPTMTLGKSCKLIPVMIMHWVIYNKKFRWYKYLSVAIVTIGVSSFMLLQPVADTGKAVQSTSLYGLGLLLINLMIDGATNSTQDAIFQAHPEVTGQTMMLAMNGLSAVLMILELAFNPYSTELSEGLSFISTHPGVLQDMLLFGLTGAIGQVFIFYTLQEFGSLSLVTVTVTRKLFTMVISVFWFKHHMSLWQWGSIALVFTGIFIEEHFKKADKLKTLQDKAKKVR